jgi:hypothetical protein
MGDDDDSHGGARAGAGGGGESSGGGGGGGGHNGEVDDDDDVFTCEIMAEPGRGALDVESYGAVHVADKFKAYDVGEGNECNLHCVKTVKYKNMFMTNNITNIC